MTTQAGNARAIPTGRSVSIVTPVYDPGENHFISCWNSVRNQTSDQWEWVVAVAGHPSKGVEAVLSEMEKDHRVKIIRLSENGGISANSNRALEHVTTDYMTLLDHDDVLLPDAIEEFLKAICCESETDLFYSDEAKLLDDGRVVEPFFKPEWSPTRLEGQMYFGHALLIRTSLVREAGGFRTIFDGSQDYDLCLRLVSLGATISHIPSILYLWRVHALSTAGGHAQKPLASEAGRRALQSYLDASGRSASAMDLGEGCYRVVDRLKSIERVSVLIPTTFRRNPEMTDPEVIDCLKALEKFTTYPDLEVLLVVDIKSSYDECADYVAHLRNTWRANPFTRNWEIHLIDACRSEEGFNFSRSINLGSLSSTGSILILMNDDVRVSHNGWLEEILSRLQNPLVGVVAPLLLDTRGYIATMGVTTSYHLAHRDVGHDPSIPRNFNLGRIAHEASAVTGALLAVSKKDFITIGGFSEDMPNNFNDIDFCFKVGEIGKSCVVTPFARAIHKESATRDTSVTREEVIFFRARWSTRLARDPFYPSALSLFRNDSPGEILPDGSPRNDWQYFDFGVWEVPDSSPLGLISYLRDNPDVAAGLPSGNSDGVWKHIIENGIVEGRRNLKFRARRYAFPAQSWPIDGDNYEPDRYLNLNEDVRAAIHSKEIESVEDHWLEFGRKEGRRQSGLWPEWLLQTEFEWPTRVEMESPLVDEAIVVPSKFGQKHE